MPPRCLPKQQETQKQSKCVYANILEVVIKCHTEQMFAGDPKLSFCLIRWHLSELNLFWRWANGQGASSDSIFGHNSWMMKTRGWKWTMQSRAGGEKQGFQRAMKWMNSKCFKNRPDDRHSMCERPFKWFQTEMLTADFQGWCPGTALRLQNQASRRPQSSRVAPCFPNKLLCVSLHTSQRSTPG